MAGRSVRKEKAQKRSVIVAFLVTLVFAAVFSLLIYKTRQQNASLEKNREAILASVRAEIVTASQLSEQEGQELTEEEIIRIARERYGLVFPNEILFVPKE